MFKPPQRKWFHPVLGSNGGKRGKEKLIFRQEPCHLCHLQLHQLPCVLLWVGAASPRILIVTPFSKCEASAVNLI